MKRESGQRRNFMPFRAMGGWKSGMACGVVGWLGLTLAPQRAVGQEAAAPLTLEQAYQRALSHHPSIVRTEALAGAARSRVREARAGMLPSIVVQGTAVNGPLGAPAFGALGNPANFGALPLSVQGMAGDPVKKQFGGGVNINQLLYDSGRTQHLVAARKDLFQAAQHDADTQKALVLLNVQQTYLNTLRAQQLVTIQQDDMRQREATVAQARLLVEGQVKSAVDLQIAEARRAEANVALIAAQNEVRYAFAALNNALGETTLTTYQLTSYPANPNPLSAQLSTKDPSINEPSGSNSSGSNPPLKQQNPRDVPAPAALPPIEEVVQHALAQRPELKSARLQRESTEQTLRGVRSELLPRLDAIASLGVVNPGTVIHNSQNYAVGVALSIPLYTGGQVEGRIAEEKQRDASNLAAERETVETIKLQVSRAWLDIQTREAQVRAAQEQVRAASGSLQLASERYRLQLSSIVELTEAETLATRAKAELTEAQYDLEIAHAVLDWATGTTYRRYVLPTNGSKG